MRSNVTRIVVCHDLRPNSVTIYVTVGLLYYIKCYITIAYACDVVPRRGFEPLTCPLGGGRAIQLCHRGLIGEV